MSDRIERETLVAAPLAKVWDAVSDHRQFGQWFGVALDQPFTPGTASTGYMTIAGYEHVRWTAQIMAVEPPRRLAFRWHPYALDRDRDYSSEPTTLVELILEPAGGHTRVRVVESGFDALPAARRDEAFRMNGRGWDAQINNIQRHVEG